MKNIKLILMNKGFWVLIYIIGVTLALILTISAYYKHECPQPTMPELRHEAIKQLNDINNAESNNDIDSLFFKLYGFKPTR